MGWPPGGNKSNRSSNIIENRRQEISLDLLETSYVDERENTPHSSEETGSIRNLADNVGVGKPGGVSTKARRDGVVLCIIPSTKPHHSGLKLPTTKNGRFNFGDAHVFSTLEANYGYWKVTIAPQDISNTCFKTHMGIKVQNDAVHISQRISDLPEETSDHPVQGSLESMPRVSSLLYCFIARIIMKLL